MTIALATAVTISASAAIALSHFFASLPNKADMARQLTDVLIIGGGPAGLQAALALSRVRRTAKLFDSQKYRNIPQVTQQDQSVIHTQVLADGMPVADFHRQVRANISHYGATSFIDSEVVRASKDGDDLFTVDTRDGEKHRGRKLILATGSVDIFPDVAGFQELWGTNIGACPFCHGYEEIDRTMAVWQPSHPMTIAMFGIWSTLTDKPLFFLMDGKPVDESVKDGLDSLLANGHHLVEDKVARLQPIENEQAAGKSMLVHFEGGRQPLHIDWLVIAAPTKSRAQHLNEQLGIELDAMQNIKVDATQHTNVPGVFAAGDGATMMKSVPNAVNSGGLAAGMAAHELVIEDLKLRVTMPAPPPKVDGIASAGPPVKF